MLNIVENGNHIILTNKTLYGFTNKSTEKCAPTNFGERASILRGILRRRDSTHEGFYNLIKFGCAKFFMGVRGRVGCFTIICFRVMQWLRHKAQRIIPNEF